MKEPQQKYEQTKQPTPFEWLLFTLIFLAIVVEEYFLKRDKIRHWLTAGNLEANFKGKVLKTEDLSKLKQELNAFFGDLVRTQNEVGMTIRLVASGQIVENLYALRSRCNELLSNNDTTLNDIHQLLAEINTLQNNVIKEDKFSFFGAAVYQLTGDIHAKIAELVQNEDAKRYWLHSAIINFMHAYTFNSTGFPEIYSNPSTIRQLSKQLGIDIPVYFPKINNN